MNRLLLRFYLFVSLIAIGITHLKAQSYYNQTPEFIKANGVWSLFRDLGLNFNDRTNFVIPTALSGINADTMPTGNYSDGGNKDCASVSDRKTGDLLFYSNGGTCWNKDNKPMPNGRGLWGNSMGAGPINTNIEHQYLTAQGVCIVPIAGDSKKYYLFSLEGFWGSMAYNGYGNLSYRKLYYSIIDMSLDNGRGDIVPGKKNILLDSAMISESMIAVPGNNCDVWLMLHASDSAMFKAFHITAAGIDPNPVRSSAGNQLSGADFESPYLISTMAVSPDRTKLSLSTYGGGALGYMAGYQVPPNWGTLLCSFDPAKGIVSNAIWIDSSVAHKCAFSPDNNKLYVSSLYPFIGVAQLDISVLDSASIAASKTILHIDTFTNSDQPASIKLYNDTIYITNNNIGRPYSLAAMDRINNPNLKGKACNYQSEAILFSSGQSLNRGLPNEVVFAPTPDTLIHNITDTAICSEEQKAFTLRPSLISTEYIYEWNTATTDTVLTVNKLGKYWVRYNNGCHFYVDSFTFSSFDLAPQIRINVQELSTTLPYVTYQWLLNDVAIPGATEATYSIKENGKYKVVVGKGGLCIDTSEAYIVSNVGISDDFGRGAKNISIYPNPAHDVVYINAPFSINVQLCSIEGRIIKKEEAVNRISIANLADGIYLLQITDKDGRILKTEKMIKSN